MFQRFRGWRFPWMLLCGLFVSSPASSQDSVKDFFSGLLKGCNLGAEPWAGYMVYTAPSMKELSPTNRGNTQGFELTCEVKLASDTNKSGNLEAHKPAGDQRSFWDDFLGLDYVAGGFEKVTASGLNNIGGQHRSLRLESTGVYIGPRLKIKTWNKDEPWENGFYTLFTLGYYWLSSSQMVNGDSPGYAALDGSAFGSEVGIGWWIKLLKTPITIGPEVGYRLLRFHSIRSSAQEKFNSSVRAPDSLDFRGWHFMLGLHVKFGLSK